MIRRGCVFLSLLVCGGFLSGCTNYMYTGTISAPDSAGVDREVVLYWPKTTWFGQEKAGPLVLMTQCGGKLTFTELGEPPEKIAYRGDPGRDRLADSNERLVEGTVCAEVMDAAHFVDMNDPIRVRVFCEAVGDDDGFIVVQRYIGASDQPYSFAIDVERKFRLFGGGIAAPVEPSCNQP